MNSAWLICCIVLGSDPEPITIDRALLTVIDQSEVPARDAGLLLEVTAREGQTVKAGDLLARLDDAEAKLAQSKATIDLERAQKLATNDIKLRQAKVELAFAEGELARAKDAAKKLANSVSDAEFDRLSSNVERTRLEIEQAQFELDAAKSAVNVFDNELRLTQVKLHRRRVTSPISGSVVSVSKRLGEWVQPGETVVRILATDKLRVEFFLKSEMATAELVGKSCRFAVAGSMPGSAAFVGRVTVVSPEVDPLNDQVRVWAEIDNRDGRLRPGLTGSLVISR